MGYSVFCNLLVLKWEIIQFRLTCKTYLIFMFGCHVEIKYSERRYQQAIDDCKYSAQHFNTVAICAFAEGKNYPPIMIF